VLTWLSNFTSARGWVLLVLTALGGYLTLGMLGAFAFAIGAAAGLSASGEWEEEVEDVDRGAPPRGGDAADSPFRERWSNWCGRSTRNLHFSALTYPIFARTPA
jgi:hypothetical protein